MRISMSSTQTTKTRPKVTRDSFPSPAYEDEVGILLGMGSVRLSVAEAHQLGLDLLTATTKEEDS